MTTMASVDKEDEILSWPGSASLKRFCDSRYATGVAQALIKMQIQDLDIQTEENSHLLDSPTYAAVVETVYKTLVDEVDIREDNSILFSAKDDAWDVEWKQRTSFLLRRIKKSGRALRLFQMWKPHVSARQAPSEFPIP